MEIIQNKSLTRLADLRLVFLKLFYICSYSLITKCSFSLNIFVLYLVLKKYKIIIYKKI